MNFRWWLFLGRVAAAILFFIFMGFATRAQTVVSGQTGVGAIHGQVTDPSGAVVGGASVIVTGADGKVLSATTDRQGAFDLKGVAPGKYKVEIFAKGFAPFAQQDVLVSAGQIQQVTAALEIEVQQQQVAVTDQSGALDVSPSNNAGAIIINGAALDALPDDPDELQTDLTALAGPSAGPNGGQFYIDGFTAGQLPPKSSIREIRINANPFSAQYDKVGYGRIEIFTKPGTDKWHGGFSVNANASGLNTKNPFFDAQNSTESEFPSYHSLQYSGNIGGPLSKKASFFFTAEVRDINDLGIVNAQIVNASNAIVPFSAAIPNPRTRDNIGPRLDYAISKTNTLTARYQYYRDRQENDGVGGFVLPEAGFNTLSTEQTVQIGDTQIYGTKVVNETRFQFLHEQSNQDPLSIAPSINVPLSFTGGGSSGGTTLDSTNRYELQNYTSIQFTKHFVKFGVRLRGVTDHNSSTAGFNSGYSFASIQSYQQTLLDPLAPAASQYTITSSPTFNGVPNPLANASMFDVGLYVEDDWRVRPNITLSYGLRFESQNDISNHANWAPRLGFAWGFGGGKTSPKMVLRAGYGIFYDRFGVANVLETDRFNLENVAQFTVTNPTFFSATPVQVMPSPTTFLTKYQINPNFRAPYLMQTAVSLERQLTKTANVTVSYLNSRGWDQLFQNNINTPLPGTITFPYYQNPTTGTRPFGNTNIYEYESDGIFRQTQLFVQGTVRAGSKVTLFAYYVLNYANSDTSGGFPSNPFNVTDDYGRASFDVRNRFFLGGSVGLPWGLRFSPFLIASSGSPYNITLSQDLIGSSQFNQRPALVSSVTSANDVVVPGFGIFDTVPQPGEKLVPINSLTGPGRFTLNVRLAKTFNFGPETKGASASGGGQGGGGGGGRGGGGGGGGRGGANPFGGGGPGAGGGGGGASSSKRYGITLSVNARNVFNVVNLATPSAVLSPPTADSPVASFSRFFGVSNGLAGGAFSSGAANRQIYLQAGFSF
jgi:carboxypeptidase family protein